MLIDSFSFWGFRPAAVQEDADLAFDLGTFPRLRSVMEGGAADLRRVVLAAQAELVTHGDDLAVAEVDLYVF